MHHPADTPPELRAPRPKTGSRPYDAIIAASMVAGSDAGVRGSQDEDGRAYGGRPRGPSRAATRMRAAARGTTTKFASLYAWKG